MQCCSLVKQVVHIVTLGVKGLMLLFPLESPEPFSRTLAVDGAQAEGRYVSDGRSSDLTHESHSGLACAHRDVSL
jgi:hypothetical protein